MIELCQVSDIRAGGLPKVKMSFPLSNVNVREKKKKKLYHIWIFKNLFDEYNCM